MEYQKEIKSHSTGSVQACQNCKNDFTITEQDIELLQKMGMPTPSFCNPCQMTERMLWRNERTLYKRPNQAPDKTENIISIYSAESKVVVYDSKTWWGDSWDPKDYAMDYDFNKPFFKQFEELIKKVPFPALQNWNAINSEYCNCTSDNKNCYMVFGGDFNEDTMYSMYNAYTKNVSDVYWLENSEFCYEMIMSDKCYQVLYSEYARDCRDSMFLYDCVNCSNCIGCVSLRNKSYCILNEQYSKESYEQKVNELKLHTFSGRENFNKLFEDFKLRNPKRFSHMVKTQNCTGDRITKSKDCINCFDIVGPAENLKDCYTSGWNAKDLLRSSQAGFNSELIFNSFGVFSDAQKVYCSAYCPTSIEVFYSYNCASSTNLFGCVGLKKGSYSILNKQYTKEEYLEMIEKIKIHMDEMPYVDSKGRVYRFGDFFPGELSIFCYNESVAQDLFPKTEDEIINTGFGFYKKNKNTYIPTINASDLPDELPVEADYLEKEIIGCFNEGKYIYCTTAFRLTKVELDFYKRLNIPLPRYCFNCRHYTRFNKLKNISLYERQCMCEKENHTQHNGGERCSVEFETSYAPERSEIVYCEKCYQQEVY